MTTRVDVRVVPILSPAARAEEDHLLGINLGDDSLDHLVKEFVGDGYHFSVFLFIERQVSGSRTSRKSNLR